MNVFLPSQKAAGGGVKSEEGDTILFQADASFAELYYFCQIVIILDPQLLHLQKDLLMSYNESMHSAMSSA
jgi:hypothetical protein